MLQVVRMFHDSGHSVRNQKHAHARFLNLHALRAETLP